MRAAAPLVAGVYTYFQMTVLGPPDVPNGGASLSVGLSTQDMPLTSLVGASPRSIGIYATGQIMLDSRWYGSSVDSSFGHGSTVGVLACVAEAPDSDDDDVDCHERGLVRVRAVFTVDGVPVNALSDLDSKLRLPPGTAAWPTLTLHSPNTLVMCRFSADDILLERGDARGAIGAPPGVEVRALDGTVLLPGKAPAHGRLRPLPNWRPGVDAQGQAV